MKHELSCSSPGFSSLSYPRQSVSLLRYSETFKTSCRKNKPVYSMIDTQKLVIFTSLSLKRPTIGQFSPDDLLFSVQTSRLNFQIFIKDKEILNWIMIEFSRLWGVLLFHSSPGSERLYKYNFSPEFCIGSFFLILWGPGSLNCWIIEGKL